MAGGLAGGLAGRLADGLDGGLAGGLASGRWTSSRLVKVSIANHYFRFINLVVTF